MQIRLATQTDKGAWDDYVLRHPDGTAYHFFAWKEAVEKSYGFNGIYLVAEDHARICGVLPLVDFRVPLLGRALISLPYCDAGGVLADSDEVERRLISCACAKALEASAVIRLRSTRPLLSCGPNHTNKVSMVLELPDQSEKLLSSYKSKFRLKIKKPARDGLTVALGKDHLIGQFYSVFKENMRDLGSPVHSHLWVRNIISAYEDRARVAVAYAPDKSPAAAGIILLHPRRVSNPWSSSLRRYNTMRPNTLLYWELLSFAADNGYKEFDFGRSTPDEGTYQFKCQWGAQPRPLFWYETAAPRAGSVSSTGNEKAVSLDRSPRRQLAASLWQKLPQAGTDWLGPKVRKFISL